MQITTYNFIKTDKFLDDLPTLGKRTGTLLRLAKLDAALPKTSARRPKALDDLKKVWQEAEAKLSISPQQAVETALQGLSKLSINTIYKAELEQAASADMLKKLLRRFQKDILTIVIPPLTKSHKGLKGPTFLVNYQRLNQAKSLIRIRSHVIKWTEPVEIISQRIYAAFSQNFSTQAPAFGFVTARAAALNFAQGIYETSSGQQHPLRPEAATHLKNSLLELAKISAPDQPPVDPCVLFVERIEGENLFDFARSKYQYLTIEQKQLFFKQLGKVAMLDLIIGHNDRLVQTISDKHGYKLYDLEANLGNIMVAWSPDAKNDPLLYVIDNGIDEKLISDVDARNQYITFLKKLFLSADWPSQIADNMRRSIECAIRNQADDESCENVAEVKQQMKAISADLDQIAFDALRGGIQEMAVDLQKQLIPNWESPAALPLRQYLEVASPDIHKSIQERINECKTARILA